MNYAVGHNMSGYLPDNPPYVVATFEEARSIIIHDLKFQEDYAESEDEAEGFCAAAEDVNLWNTPQDIAVHGEVWFIAETDEELDAEDGES